METRATRTYQESSLSDLRAAILKIATTKDSTDRRETVEKLQKLAQTTQEAKVLTGDIVFEVVKIELEYRFVSPTRSRLYNTLNNEVLKIKDHPLNAYDRLAYLYRLYQFKKSKLKSDDVKALAELDSTFLPVVNSVLKSTPDLQVALIKRPDPVHLEELEKLPNIYDGIRAGYWLWDDPIEHTKDSRLIKFLTSSETEASSEAKRPSEADEIIMQLSESKSVNNDAFKELRYALHYAMALHIMLRIEKSCEATPYKPTSYALYNKCKNMLNIEHTQDVPELLKFNYFLDLKNFLIALTSNEKAVKVLNSYMLKNNMKFEDAQAYFKAQANSLDSILKSEAFLFKASKCLTNWGFLLIGGLAFAEGASAIYGLGIGRGALVNIGTLLGKLFIRGPWGAYIGAAIAKRHEAEKLIAIITNAFAYGFSYMQDYTEKGPASDLEKLRSRDVYHAELKADVRSSHPEFEAAARKLLEWYQALTQLPSSGVIQPEILERIRRTIVVPMEKPTATQDEERRLIVGCR